MIFNTFLVIMKIELLLFTYSEILEENVHSFDGIESYSNRTFASTLKRILSTLHLQSEK